MCPHDLCTKVRIYVCTYTLATALFPVAIPPVIATKNIIVKYLFDRFVLYFGSVSTEHCVVYCTRTQTALIAKTHTALFDTLLFFFFFFLLLQLYTNWLDKSVTEKTTIRKKAEDRRQKTEDKIKKKKRKIIMETEFQFDVTMNLGFFFICA